MIKLKVPAQLYTSHLVCGAIKTNKYIAIIINATP